MSTVPFGLRSSPACGVSDSHMWGSHTYVSIRFGYFLLLIGLTSIRPARRTLRVEGSLFLPHTSELRSSNKHRHWLSLRRILYTHSTANKSSRNDNKEDRLGKAVLEQGEARAQEDQETGRGRRASGQELNNHGPLALLITSQSPPSSAPLT